MDKPVVAILGTRYRDFAIEEEALHSTGATILADPGATPEAIVKIAGAAQVILAGSAPRFTPEVLEELTCKGIVRYGVGTDSIDLPTARRLGIAVARVSDYGTEAVAFHAVSSAVALLRRLPEADRSIRAGGWGFADLRPLHLPSTLTAGVVGYGRIGKQAARYFSGLGFTVQAFDEYVEVDGEQHTRAPDLATLLETSDVVSLHAPGNPDGAPLLGRDLLGRMSAGSVLVNTARGSLIDVAALVAGLREGRPARVALDVFPSEPADLSLFAGVEDQILFSPHMAWYTDESESDMRRKAADEAVRLLNDVPLRDPVVTGGR